MSVEHARDVGNIRDLLTAYAGKSAEHEIEQSKRAFALDPKGVLNSESYSQHRQ
jgi:hypothetical protein